VTFRCTNQFYLLPAVPTSGQRATFVGKDNYAKPKIFTSTFFVQISKANTMQTVCRVSQTNLQHGRLENLGSVSGRAETSYFRYDAQTRSGLRPISCLIGIERSFLSVKRTGPEANHTSPSMGASHFTHALMGFSETSPNNCYQLCVSVHKTHNTHLTRSEKIEVSFTESATLERITAWCCHLHVTVGTI
jgi:hypothetical protein